MKKLAQSTMNSNKYVYRALAKINSIQDVIMTLEAKHFIIINLIWNLVRENFVKVIIREFVLQRNGV